MSQELIFQLVLSLIKGVGSITAKKLIAYCGGPEAVFKEKIANLNKIPTIGNILANQRVELPETSVNTDSTVGIHSNENFQFSVCPQPAKDLLHIELTGTNSQFTLQLIDISGKLIWNKDLNSNYDITINLAIMKYARGVYFLKFQSFQFNRIEKVILN